MQLQKIKNWVNTHDHCGAPAAEIVGQHVRIYTAYANGKTGEFEVRHTDVSTLADARDILGY